AGLVPRYAGLVPRYAGSARGVIPWEMGVLQCFFYIIERERERAKMRPQKLADKARQGLSAASFKASRAVTFTGPRITLL
ncbi:MAG: hypothetical protein LBT11_05500, partial [Treponema sp.]|nr:hypothetical protein [Treponema sp.]